MAMKASSESLEFTVILNEIISYARSPEGREVIQAQEPFRDEGALREELNCTRLTYHLLEFCELPGSGSFPEISELLKRVEKPGIHLDAEELYAVGLYLQEAVHLVSWLTAPQKGYTREMPEVEVSLPETAASSAREILQHLEAPGIIRENHPRLKPLYRELDRCKQERSRLSAKLMKDDPTLWQQDTPTVRDGRIVLPIKSSQKQKVSGFVHGFSATGNTIFVEPQSLVESNNRVVMQEQVIQEEYLAILKEISSLIRGRLDEIEQTRAVVGRCDQLFAKARFSQIYSCESPGISQRYLNLRQARHPLLGKNVIPIDVEIPEDKLAVIMTGPNAGGKTVSVKTVGLMAMMVRHGMLIPASSESQLPLFSSIHADIGDDQSIAESLSTFSGHMKKISHILEHIDGHSLVIFDELASGTDTYEGAALAKSIIEHCLTIGCLTLVTSHHMSLKQYGYTDSRVLNASMEFDDERKVPTYRILFGSPGNSYAIETAQRMGLPEPVIQNARSYLQDESDRTTAMVRKLEQQELELHQKEQKLTEREQELREQERSVDLRTLQLRQQELMFRKKDISYLRRFIQESRSELENLIRSLREGELSREKIQQVKDFQSRLDEKEQSFRRTVSQQEASVSQGRGHEFAPGMKVLAGKAKTEGVVARKGKKPGYWLVEMGNLRIDIHENDLAPIELESNTRYDSSDIVDISYDRQAGFPAFELDVRGKTLEAALQSVEDQIDRSVLHGMGRFGIIHGKGEGVLQRGIHQRLSDHPSVKSYSFAHPDEGGFGKTIVEIRI